MSDLVIGTAGHVDHGKTSLVRALTGVDLDTLPEERARGITIALGFVPLPLPSGRTAGLVDVPGHEKLVRTMVAGASGIDAVMLCVSAAEGVMPQTREHLDVITLLGVQQGVLVLTMADLVEPDLLELAAEELRETVAGTALAAAPIVATSAQTGQGLDALRAALDGLSPRDRPVDAPFRLPVDRAFVRKGFGTVVTGTTWGGRILDGAEVELLPGGERARVRGVQVHGRPVHEARAGSRTALNLAGIETDAVGRGLWACEPGQVPATRVIDVAYRQLAGDLLDGAGVVALLGTREVAGRVHVIAQEMVASGSEAFVQLHLAEPLPCLPGDRFVLRRASPATTLGGGTVLDPWAPTARHRDDARVHAELVRLAAGDRLVLLERCPGLVEPVAKARGVLGLGVKIGDRHFAPATVEALEQALRDGLAAAHASDPLSPGINRKAAQLGPLRMLEERAFLGWLEAQASRGAVVLEGGRVRLPGWTVVLDASQADWCRDTTRAAVAAGYEGLESAPPIAARDALLFLLRDRGEIELVGGRIYARSVLDRLVAAVRSHFATHPSMDPAAFKELTGQSRRTAIPLLEWLDAQGITRRVGDSRVLALSPPQL
ncbi:MAG: selenocysteine-specific translation elongation factor [Deltaproteobacteria bacterium]|nr:selenocysteine-specific translation elongation factor [Deltaproteobacteria bacterium]